jgi:hypothetical protein
VKGNPLLNSPDDWAEYVDRRNKGVRRNPQGNWVFPDGRPYNWIRS